MTRLTLLSPLPGWVSPLDEVPDAVFAGGMLGDGVAIDPTGTQLVAPCAATVLSVHAARHAVTLRTDDGADVLIHMGIDTVALGGAGFTVRVAAGHSDSDYDTAMAAFAAGASGVTHLYNAMTPLGHRAPGLTGAALDWGRAWCGLIADGVHVHPAALRLATRLLSADRAILVTDAMPSVGAAHKDFTLYGRPIHVADGVCRGADGTLAGSDLDMAQAVANMVQLVGVAPQAAAAMAAANPAAFLGLSHERGALAPGLRADWVWLDAGFRARGTWIGGEQVAHGA